MSHLEKVTDTTAGWMDERLGAAGYVRKSLNKVFPDHWSFMLGEIALYSFIILLLTGTYLSFFYTPSLTEVVYDGSYIPLKGVTMSQAYESTLFISFDVRGGLIMRQIHHWAALLFLAAIVVHLLRVFFTGAFRKPRELNWVIGVLLLILGLLEGFAGYSCPTTCCPAPAPASSTASSCRFRSSAPGPRSWSTAASTPAQSCSTGSMRCTSSWSRWPSSA